MKIKTLMGFIGVSFLIAACGTNESVSTKTDTKIEQDKDILAKEEEKEGREDEKESKGEEKETEEEGENDPGTKEEGENGPGTKEEGENGSGTKGEGENGSETKGEGENGSGTKGEGESGSGTKAEGENGSKTEKKENGSGETKEDKSEKGKEGEAEEKEKIEGAEEAQGSGEEKDKIEGAAEAQESGEEESKEQSELTAAELEEILLQQPCYVERIDYVNDNVYDTNVSVVVKNNSGTDIKNVYYAMAGWDANNLPLILYTYKAVDGIGYVVETDFGDANIIDGGTYGEDLQFGIMERTASRLQTFKAVVVKYEDFDGNTWENPYYADWIDIYKEKRLE